MKKMIMVFALLLMLPGLVACGKKDNKRTSISNRNARDPINQPVGNDPQTSRGGTQLSNQGYIYGQIYNSGAYGRSDAQFEQNVRGFTSATLDPWGDPNNGVAPELGQVSGQPGQSTGVWIRGDARVVGGNFDPNGGNQRQLDANATNIRIIVWDSYAGQTDSSGNAIPEYAVSFTSATTNSFINYQNRSAVITFQDEYGWVKFSGTFDAEYFSGTVEYYNNDYVSTILSPNAGAWDGIMGEFYISTCGFFYCD
jgi:hypothetical protein